MRCTIVFPDGESSHGDGETFLRDGSTLAPGRNVVTAAALVLVPTAALSAGSRVALALAVAEAAVLAIVTGYAVYLGIYRYPR